MSVCEICGEEEPVLVKCKVCGTRFCEFCGDHTEKLCIECSDSDRDDEDTDDPDEDDE
jgi:hypothetical protein